MGKSITFAELNSRSRALAGLLSQRGVTTGGQAAILPENSLTYEVAWAAQRSGLH
jgi:long-chain acyl-CoA synthetase